MSNLSNKTIILNKLKQLQKLKTNSEYWNITWDQGIFISDIIELKKPKNILEIGTSNGFSTLWILKNIDYVDFKMFTIEVNKERFNIAQKNFEKLKLKKNIVQINDEALNTLSEFEFGVKFDFIFLDAGHLLYKDLILKLEERKLLSNNAVIIADNVKSHKHLSKFIQFMNQKYNCELVELGAGFLIASLGN